jgi:hypothetical protein
MDFQHQLTLLLRKLRRDTIFSTIEARKLLYACQVFHFDLPGYISLSLDNLERIQDRALKTIYADMNCFNEQSLHLFSLTSIYYADLNTSCYVFFRTIMSHPNN